MDTAHPGEWSDTNRAAFRERLPSSRMNLLGVSPDGSEPVVFRDRLTPLFRNRGLDLPLLRQADHRR